MRQTIVISLLLLAVAFSLLNTEPLTLNFLIWRVETLVAVAVITALSVGLICGALLMMPWGMREHRALKEARLRATDLEKRLAAGSRANRGAGARSDSDD